MMGKRVKLSLLLLFIILLVYIVLQTMFIVKSYDLERRNFDFIARAVVGETFFETNVKRDLLDGYASDLKKRVDGEYPDSTELKRELGARLKEYQAMPSRMREKLAKAGIDTEFKYMFTVSRFDLINTDRGVVKLINTEIFPDGLIVLGDLKKKEGQRFSTSFHLRDLHSYIQLNFHVEFPDLIPYAIGKVEDLIWISAIAVLLVAAIAVFTGRTIIRQEELSRMKSDFIDNITHEINTPIATIGVAVKNMEHPSVLDKPDRIKEMSEVVKRQNLKLQELVGGIMRISFMNTGIELKREQISLNDAVAEIVEEFSFRNPSASIETCLVENSPVVACDMFLLTTAVMNLLDNSHKYSPSEKTIEVEVKSDGGWSTVQIRDRGCGIDRRHRKKIFDKFYRVSDGNIHNVKGLGVGLYTVKKIVEAHGGKVDLVSRPGEGSSFSLILPEVESV